MKDSFLWDKIPLSGIFPDIFEAENPAMGI